jgi:hypothetical protein
MKVDLHDVDAVVAKLADLGPQAREQAAGALFEIAEEIIAQSQLLVPVDLGTLKNSKFVEPPHHTTHDISVTMGYGGQAKDYAIVQHERLDFHHTVGQAKYLETPFVEARRVVLTRLASKIRERLS